MAFIAKIALPYRGRFIRKGEKVPPDYKRFAEGIKRGWIEVTGDPAATPPPVKESEAALPPVVVDPNAEQLAVTGTSTSFAPDEPPAYVEPSIEDLDYLNPMAQKSLAQKGIERIHNLEGWDVEALDELKGIGVKLAERLLADFAEYEEWKESFSEYTEITESATDETGEDEGAEND